jgi:hypothetical protein
MSVDITTWRARIGLFLKYRPLSVNKKRGHVPSVFQFFFLTFLSTLAWPIFLGALFFILIILIWCKKNQFVIKYSKVISSKNFRTLFLVSTLCADLFVLTQLIISIIFKMLLVVSGCVEINPGPDSKINFGVWNLISYLRLEYLTHHRKPKMNIWKRNLLLVGASSMSLRGMKQVEALRQELRVRVKVGSFSFVDSSAPVLPSSVDLLPFIPKYSDYY